MAGSAPWVPTMCIFHGSFLSAMGLCTMCALCLQALNPLLDQDACERLIEHLLLWQELCVLHDKLARCILRCDAGAASRPGGMDASLAALEQELTNKRAWSSAEHPEWLAFEVLQRVEIRHRQYVVAKHMLENAGRHGMRGGDRGAVVQLNMGEGKTRVILPMLVLALSGRGQLVRLNFLQELLPEAVEYLHSCLTGLFEPTGTLAAHVTWRWSRWPSLQLCAASAFSGSCTVHMSPDLMARAHTVFTRVNSSDL